MVQKRVYCVTTSIWEELLSVGLARKLYHSIYQVVLRYFYPEDPSPIVCLVEKRKKKATRQIGLQCAITRIALVSSRMSSIFHAMNPLVWRSNRYWLEHLSFTIQITSSVWILTTYCQPRARWKVFFFYCKCWKFYDVSRRMNALDVRACGLYCIPYMYVHSLRCLYMMENFVQSTF
jgi:hypothetical protein